MVEDSYYDQVRSAYDRIALQYDDSTGKYAVSRRAKQLALAVIREMTPQQGHLLDVGCYTGIEALLLAQQGFHVVGVDLSEEMIRLARSKAARWRLADLASFEVMPASGIGALGDQHSFDTVYSVFGTLNLEPRISEFKAGLSRVLKDDGAFVCGLLNPTVFYELVFAPLLLKFHGYRKLAKSRVRTRIGLGTDTVESFLYSPGEFAALMEPQFSLERVTGLHILYPPPRGAMGRDLWWIPRALDGVEARLESHFPFAWLGFFSLLVFRRSARGSR